MNLSNIGNSLKFIPVVAMSYKKKVPRVKKPKFKIHPIISNIAKLENLKIKF